MKYQHKYPYREPASRPEKPYFNYDEAFSRNIGWVTEGEQQKLKEKRIAIAGMGGVGGVHLLTLARMGFSKFHIADLDNFELANFNRQVGATIETIDKPKAAVLEKMAKDINPEAEIQVFPDGVNDGNVEEFLAGVDLYVDGFDFFVLDIRAKVFAKCHEKGIPAITAAPVGTGSAYLIFMPDGMSFEQYFRLNGFSERKKYVNFLLGLTPAMLQRSYLQDKTRVDFAAKRGPSTPMACQICAGVTATEAVKILLGRGKIYPAPHYHHFDPYRSRYVVGKLWLGNRNPLQTVKRHLAYRLFDRLALQARPKEEEISPTLRPVEHILNLARWAPSGDNIQPWRFEIVSDFQVRIQCDLTANDSVYEFDNARPTRLALGMLLETMKIAATRFGWAGQWITGERDGRITVEYYFRAVKDVAADPLADFIPVRSTDRRRYRQLKLSEEQKAVLADALGPDLTVRWFESVRERTRIARLSSKATAIRLTIPECHTVHQKIIDWSSHFSRSGIPAAAVGLDPATTILMKWLMKDWRRMKFMNRTLGGALLAAFQLDVIPGLLNAAQFSIHRTSGLTGPEALDDILRTGAALQRFWLTAARYGLVLQPNFAPLCFAHYGRTGHEFTADPRQMEKAGNVAALLERTVGGEQGNPVFLGRIGYPLHRSAPARSLRLSLDRLTASR